MYCRGSGYVCSVRCEQLTRANVALRTAQRKQNSAAIYREVLRLHGKDIPNMKWNCAAIYDTEIRKTTEKDHKGRKCWVHTYHSLSARPSGSCVQSFGSDELRNVNSYKVQQQELKLIFIYRIFKHNGDALLKNCFAS